MNDYCVIFPFCGGKIAQPKESHVGKKQLEALRGITAEFAIRARRIHRDRHFERPVADMCIVFGILAVPRRAKTVNQSDGALDCRFLTFWLDELLGEDSRWGAQKQAETR